MTRPTYSILWAGFLHTDEVDQDLRPRRWIDDQSVAERIKLEIAWQAALERAVREGKPLYDSPAVRLRALSESGGRLALGYELTSYRDYVSNRPDARQQPFSGNPDPIGTALIAVTADGRVPLGKRTTKADANPGRFFTFGGFFDPEMDLDAEGQPDIFACAVREWHEETGLPMDPSDLRMISVVYDHVYPHPEAAFRITCGLTSAEFEGSAWQAELADLCFVPLPELEPFLDRHAHEFTDSLAGALSVMLTSAGEHGRDAR